MSSQRHGDNDVAARSPHPVPSRWFPPRRAAAAALVAWAVGGVAVALCLRALAVAAGTAAATAPGAVSESAAVVGAPNTLAASGSASAVQAVLRAVNKARAAQGRPGYTLSSRLGSGAAAHDRTMAGGCGLSHRCPGEPSLGQRESAQGVWWTACGENIGEGGGVAASASAEAATAVGLTRQMLAERPPDDGHRRNLLSSRFTHVGIAVIRDSSGTVWMTQDFSN